MLIASDIIYTRCYSIAHFENILKCFIAELALKIGYTYALGKHNNI